MKQKYNTVIIISMLLVFLSLSISIINYIISLDSAQKQLKNQALPLSLDNIYTEIQKNIIEPHLVSSMMANDTFLHNWIVHDENKQEQIKKYLEAIKNKYGVFNTFLVSEETKNYYTQNGFLEKISKENKDNKWYFEFKSSPKDNEINLDFNQKMANKIIMFINHKIFDKEYHLLGVTGVAIEVSYIDTMLKDFKRNHNFTVRFFNKEGNVVLGLDENRVKSKNLNEFSKLKEYEDQILSKKPSLLEYNKNGSKYIANTKYIPELDLYLFVEAKLDNYTQNVRKIFYFNLILSLVITLIISIIIFYLIRSNNIKLESLSKYDPLTKLYNRRSFELEYEKVIKLQKRNQSINFSVLFIDIDNFKEINDTFGHTIGDMVLKEISNILKSNVRDIDVVARWGGEEFLILFFDTSFENAQKKSQKLLKEIYENTSLLKLVKQPVSASMGITNYKKNDTLDSLVSRADDAMYVSKRGKKSNNSSLNKLIWIVEWRR